MVQSPPKLNYSSTPIIPLPGDLAPMAQEVVDAFIEDKKDEKLKIDDLINLIKIDPISSICISFKAMRAVTALGEYAHKDSDARIMPSGRTTITEWIRGNFESMRGSIVNTTRKMQAQCYALGFSVAQIVWTNDEQGFGREWRLKAVNVLDPRRVELFVIRGGEIVGINYRKIDGDLVFIAYQNLLHIYTDSIEGNNPRGDAATRRASPYFKARQLLFQAWAIAGQKQATGTTVIQAPNDEVVVETDEIGKPLENPDGSPKTISALESAKRQGQRLENNSILVTSLANKVFNLMGSAGEGFFNTATIALKKEIMLCYGVPSTIFDDTASGIGNSGINAGHRLVVDVQIDAIVLEFKEQLLEKIVRPLLRWNMGVRNDFGNFATEKFLDPSLAATRVSNLITALSTGAIDANDLDAINRLREDLGIPPISKEQFDTLQMENLKVDDAYPEEEVA